MPPQNKSHHDRSFDLCCAHSVEGNQVGGVKAAIVSNNSLEIEWSPPAPSECLQYQTGVWIRVFESGQQPHPKNYVEIPQECLSPKERSNNNTFTFTLFSPDSTLISQDDKRHCHVKLKEPIEKCRPYTMLVSANYRSIKGQTLSADVDVSPLVSSRSFNLPKVNVNFKVFTLLSNSELVDWKRNDNECQGQFHWL